MIKKEAEKRAAALISEAENHSRYIKLRSYEYIDKLLYDMQNDIGRLAGEYIQPMNDFFIQTINDLNGKVNNNRREMKDLSEKLANGYESTEASEEKEQ